MFLPKADVSRSVGVVQGQTGDLVLDISILLLPRAVAEPINMAHIAGNPQQSWLSDAS